MSWKSSTAQEASGADALPRKRTTMESNADWGARSCVKVVGGEGPVESRAVSPPTLPFSEIHASRDAFAWQAYLNSSRPPTRRNGRTARKVIDSGAAPVYVRAGGEVVSPAGEATPQAL